MLSLSRYWRFMHEFRWLVLISEVGGACAGQLIPLALQDLNADIQNIFVKTPVPICMAFDGASRLGEVLVIVLRTVTEDHEVIQKLVEVRVISKSMDHSTLAHVLLKALTQELKIRTNQIIFSVRDRAAVNGAAIRELKSVIKNMTDGECICHTLDHVGEHFHTPLLDGFISTITYIFSTSPAACLLWSEMFGCTPESECPTRWWSKWQVIADIMPKFGGLQMYVKALKVCICMH